MSEVRSGSPEVLEANPLDEINNLIEAGLVFEELAGSEGAEFSLKAYREIPDFLFMKVTPRFGNEYDAHSYWRDSLGHAHKDDELYKTVSAEKPMLVKVIEFNFVSGTPNKAPIMLRDIGLSFGQDYRLPLKISEFHELFDKEIVDKREMVA